MMTCMAAMLPQDFWIEHLEKTISEYKETKLLNKPEEEIKKAFQNVGFISSMVMLKCHVGDDLESALNMTERLINLKKAEEFFNPEKS